MSIEDMKRQFSNRLDSKLSLLSLGSGTSLFGSPTSIDESCISEEVIPPPPMFAEDVGAAHPPSGILITEHPPSPRTREKDLREKDKERDKEREREIRKDDKKEEKREEKKEGKGGLRQLLRMGHKRSASDVTAPARLVPAPANTPQQRSSLSRDGQQQVKGSLVTRGPRDGGESDSSRSPLSPRRGDVPPLIPSSVAHASESATTSLDCPPGFVRNDESLQKSTPVAPGASVTHEIGTGWMGLNFPSTSIQHSARLFQLPVQAVPSGQGENVKRGSLLPLRPRSMSF